MAEIWLSPFEHLVRISTGLYMESGFLDLRSSGRCTADAYNPALLHFDAVTGAYTSGTVTPLQGTVTLVRKFWEVDTDYQIGAKITPYSEQDLSRVWVCIAGGTSGAVNPTWSDVGIVTDGPDVQWLWAPGSVGTLAEEPFDGEVLLEGQESKAIGCYVKNPTVTDPCGTIWENVLEDTFCPVSIFPKKQAQFDIPSSTYSGKLRLFVQALYGSVREDYQPFGNELKITETTTEYPTRILKKGQDGSQWLYTTSDFRYFLCTYAAGVLNLNRMVLSEEAVRFRDTLLLHSKNSDFTFVTRVEAYILSTAKIEPAVYLQIPITNDTFEGGTLDNGWHSNWKGNEASIVTFFKDPQATQYLSSQYQIAITESGTEQVGYVFSAAMVELTTDAAWWPWTSQLQLFYYNSTLQSMVPVDFPGSLFGGFSGTFDAPVYNYYALDAVAGTDTLVTVDIFMDLQDPPPNVSETVPSGTRFGSPQSVVATNIKQYSGSPIGTRGFRVGGVTTSETTTAFDTSVLTTVYPVSGPRARGWPLDFVATIGESLTHPNEIVWGAANGLSPGDTKELDFEGSMVTANWGWRAKWMFMGIDSEVNTDVHGTDGTLFCEVLLGDCSNVVVGSQLNSFSNGSSSHQIKETTSVFNGAYFPFDGQLVWFLNNSGVGKPTLEVIAGMPPDGAFVFFDAFFGNADTVLDEVNPPNPGGSTSYALFTSPSGVFGEVIVTDTSKLNEYFSPTISDKATHTKDTGRSSITGMYKVTHAAFSEDGGYLKDSSVGWT